MRTLGFASALATVAVLSSACATLSTPDQVSAPVTASSKLTATPVSRGASHFDPQWVRPGTDTMIITRSGDMSSVAFRSEGPSRQEIGMTIQTITPMTDRLGRHAFEVSFEQRDENSIVDETTTWVDANTLLPLRQEAHLGNGRLVTLIYGDGQVMAVDLIPGHQSHAFSTPVPDSAYAAAAIDLLLRALPLATDYRTSIPLYFPSDGTMFSLEVRVEGRENLTTRAGKIMDCWVVAADFPGQVTEHFWIDQHDHTLVRILAHETSSSLVRYDR
jgi:hypothetical protein